MRRTAEVPDLRSTLRYMTLLGEGFDPSGRPLALVVYRDRSYEYIPHSELEA